MSTNPKQNLDELLATNEKLKKQAESSKNCVPVSEACEVITKYVESVQDPLVMKSAEPNAWTDKKGGCSLL